MKTLTLSQIEDAAWDALMGKVPAATQEKEVEIVAALAQQVAAAIYAKQQEVR